MNKIEKAVINLGGAWPESDRNPQYLLLCIEPIAKYEAGQYHIGPSVYPNPQHWEVICTYPEFMEACKRLENKPTKWPVVAKVLVFSPFHGGWIFGTYENAVPGDFESCWYGSSSGYWMQDSKQKGRCFGDWRQSLERRPEPVHVGVDSADGPDETGTVTIKVDRFEVRDSAGSLIYAHEDAGLEPERETGVGQRMELSVLGGEWRAGVLRYRGHEIVVFDYDHDDGEMAVNAGICGLRPIQSHRDKVIEAAVQVATGVNIAQKSSTDGLTLKTINRLYEANMLKLSGEKE